MTAVRFLSETPRAFVRLLTVSALCVLLTAAPRPAHADIVWLQFLTPSSGQYNYSAAEQEQVRARVAADYAPFGHTVVLTQPTSGNYSTVQINATTNFSGSALTGGISQGIDFRNLNKNDVARVNITGLIGGSGQPANTSANQSRLCFYGCRARSRTLNGPASSRRLRVYWLWLAHRPFRCPNRK